jgi:hypothetical protein
MNNLLPGQFRAFPQFEHIRGANSRSRAGPYWARHFPGDSAAEKFARALAHRRALPVKEILESFEFFEHIRRHVRGDRVADLLCGHGLVGILFAVLERPEQVFLVDRKRPPSVDVVLEAAAEVEPASVHRVTWIADKLSHLERLLPPVSTVLAVHACGARTDQCLEVALTRGADVAAMPCCHVEPLSAPRALRDSLGVVLASDIDRTYRLQAAGYTVRWREIPAAITPMNRILLGSAPVPRTRTCC